MNIITTKAVLLAHIKANLIGRENLSIRGVAGALDVSPQSIIEGAHFKSKKLAEFLTPHGIEAAHLIENGFNAKAFWLITEYFAWESKAKAPGAKQIARTFGQIGVIETFRQLSKEPEIRERPQLKQHTVVEYQQCHEKIELINNAALRELFRDRLIDELSVSKKNRTLVAEKNEYTIAKVRATELGYSLKEIGNGSGLGKYLKKHVPVAFTERVGKYPVNHYLVSDKLDTTIHNYFGLKACLA